MSLLLLVAIVAIGITLTVAAVHFTGGSRRAGIRDEAHARELFAKDYPDIPASPAFLTVDRETAFLLLPAGATGIVHVVGAGFLTRLVAPGDIAELRLREGGTVSIRFRDFTWTGGHFKFETPQAAQRIADALSPAKASANAEA